MFLKILNRRMRRGGFHLNPIPVRLLFIQLLERIYILFWWIDMNLMVLGYPIQYSNHTINLGNNELDSFGESQIRSPL